MTEQFPRLSKAAAVSIARPTSTPGLQIAALPSSIVLDNPNNETWLRIIEHQGMTILQKTVPTDLPEMTFTIYIKNIQQKIIQRYDIYFYLPIQCDIVPKNVTSAIINETVILFFNCSSNSSRTLVYNVSGDHFELRDGKLYVIKEVNGIHEIHLSVQYERISLSKRTWSFNFTTSRPRVTRIAAELLTSNSVSLTCYTNYDFPNITYLWYISNKPVTVSVICRIQHNKLTFNGKQQFDLKSFPDVQLKAPKRSPSYSVVKYSCNANISKAFVRIRLYSFATGFHIAASGSSYTANASSLNGVGITMHSFNNITFTCFSESTFAETAYHWYLNGTKTIAGILKEMPGNQTFGYLTLTNLSKDAYVTVTCRWHYRHSFVDQRSISASLWTIPQVTLSSPGASSLYSVVKYSCISTVKNADVHVAVVPLSYKNVSYSVNKGNYEGHFIIWNDTKIFCFANYNGQRGIIQERVVLVRPVNITCKLFYSNTIVAERSINISIPSIPQVRLTSLNTSSLYSEVNYSCDSNLANADVYVAVVPLHLKDISYSVQKARYTGRFTISNDTKIFCFANYNGQRGIIQEHVIHALPVNITCKLFYSNTIVAERSINISIPSIPQVRLTSLNTSSLYSEVNYSCDSNLANADVYVAVVPLHLKDISYSVQKARYTGRFTISNDTKIFCFANYNGQRGIIQEHVIHALPVNITCKLFYSNTIVAERSINISIPSIPQVRLTSLNTSSLYSEVNYSCDSNLANADVYVAVVPLHLKDISYSVQKARYTGRFTISNDTKIFCFANYNGQRGIIQEHVIHALPGRFTIWNDTKIFCFANYDGQRGIIQEHVIHALPDKITCRLFYGNIFVKERSINTSIDSFPQVSLNSPNVSSIYSKVNYSCVSSLPNADVYVAVVPFHYKTISYSVQKAKYSGNFTIQQDMKIFCYANHNGVRGIIKQNVVFLREVQKFTIQRITTTMHSDNNRTFTCYANSTAARITYEWYVNGSRLTAGIRQSTVQNESLSELSLTNLSRNYFAIITCRTFYRTLFMDDQNITTDIASIPQVTINSQNLSLSNSVVNYNCYSNVRNADVYATAVPSTHKTVSYPAAVKGNVTGYFTMVNETKIFCYAEYGNKRGIIKSKTVYLLEIARFSILKITTKQSVNSITFTSRTDSNLTNLIHKWYFNNIDITTKMTQMMVNGKSQSEVTLSDLEENNSDTITCEVFYQTLRIDKKKIYTSISSIPQVTVNVFPMSLVGYSVNYSCKSSVKNSNVHVTVEYPGSSKSYTNVSSYMGRFQMVDDTKISCYAEGGGRRGIIKEKMVTLAKVEEFLITQITTTMHSIDNITFACYTNSSSTAITYKWYFNNSIITSGKKQMLLNRQSVGFLTLSNLRPKDKGLVTCEAYFKILRIAKKQIDFSVSTIPRVTLTSVQVANINTPVVYSCTSSVNNADVYVSSPNTESINPDQSRSSYNGKFTIISDTKISCYSKHNLLQGPVVETTVFASKGEKSCEEETVEKLVWPKTLSKKNATVSCPEGFEGSVTRQCNKDGQWENFDQSGCAKIAIIDAKAELEKISLGLSTDLATPVKELATATNTTLKKKELVISFEAITEIVEITENLKVIKEPEIINFFEIGSNLLNEDNKDVWNSIDKEDSQQVDKTPQNMMKNIEKFATVTAEKINKTLDIQKGNILVEIKKVSVNETLKLPTPEVTTTTPVWIRNSLTSVTISSESLKEVFSKNETVSVATTIFKGVSGLLQGAGKKELNSYVLSLSLAKATPVNLSNPILLNFEHLLQNFSGPQCSFWDYNLKNTTGGGWSREGCSLNSTNSTLTICACTHLTNFAILMNPWIDVETAHAIQLITTIGCWISIVALVFTIIVYITCWKHVSSRDVAKSRSVLLINLCLSLTCVYLIFLFGIDNTSDKGVCTATAILLLYFLLVAFFSMLAEVAPAIIVGISLGATQLEGFGNDKFCWLDRESGLIWALIGPVIAIIIANIICCVFALRALMSAGSILKHTTKPTTAERIKKGARAMLVLSPLLGFTWIIGLFAVNEDTVVFEYIFAILATLQGFFIFLAYCLFNDQLRKAFTESKLGSQLLSTKQSTLSLGKTITKGSLDDTNKNEVKSTSLSNYQPYESNKQKNIKSNADFIIKRNSDFDLKKK
ncbi:adhesion G-protein coupled receptor D1-like [Octopus vulgaris]|uniref:Adhesion G-protein coupled receptor D1-like n=1 Tax=Octopus vulgaris TaxID=6645 RepID=A0AA36ATY7_OCTVU|nr:adhesion G-protein coupled receptor D1-like [Octopus vulgaris]